MILLRAQNILFKPLTLSGRTWRPHHQADMNLRQQTILQLVNDRRRISVNELARASGVSEVTIRQDLNLLEKRSYLKRVHGSAVALESDDVDARMMSNFTLKQRLAQYAAAQVNDGETIFIESGSANALLARYIAERKRITLITVSHYIANLLKETDCDVIVLGGMYQKKSETVVGPLTRLCIQQVHFNKAFIGIDGFQAETGFTGRDMMRADVVSAVLAKGVENIVLTDSSKFGQIQPNPLAQPGQISRVITDSRLALEYQHQLKRRAYRWSWSTTNAGRHRTKRAARAIPRAFPLRSGILRLFTCLSFPRNLYSVSATFGP